MLDRSLLKHTTTGKRKFDIHIEKWMDGGGLSFGLEFPEVIKLLYPDRVFDWCLDWCSGPGTIGFELYSHELVNNLMLHDINGEVIRTAKKIIKDNNLENIKTLVSSSCKFLNNNIQYDLIVSNPPHFSDLKNGAFVNGSFVSVTPDAQRKAEDKNWDTHRDFFANIKSRLKENGVIILQENSHGSTVKDFQNMITLNDMCILNVLSHKIPLIYYIVIGHKHV